VNAIRTAHTSVYPTQNQKEPQHTNLTSRLCKHILSAKFI